MGLLVGRNKAILTIGTGEEGGVSKWKSEGQNAQILGVNVKLALDANHAYKVLSQKYGRSIFQKHCKKDQHNLPPTDFYTHCCTHFQTLFTGLQGVVSFPGTKFPISILELTMSVIHRHINFTHNAGLWKNIQISNTFNLIVWNCWVKRNL